MTQPRAVSNKVKWALEDVYRELLKADQQMASLIADPAQTRTGVISIAAISQGHIRSAREYITRVLPSVRDTVLSQRRGASDD